MSRSQARIASSRSSAMPKQSATAGM